VNSTFIITLKRYFRKT